MTSFRVWLTLLLSIACSILVVVWPGWLRDLRAQGYVSFTLSNSGDITVTRGGSGSTTITVRAIAGSGIVTFTLSGLPSGVTASFAPATPCAVSSPGTCSRTLTLDTTAATPLGSFTIAVSGIGSGGLVGVATTTFVLVVTPPPFDYSLAASPGSVSLTAGGAPASTTVTATLLGGTPQPVSFAVSGLPTGVTATFSAPSCSPTCSTILTLTASAAASVGTTAITVTGTNPNTPNKTTTVTLIVNPAIVTLPFNYALGASPGAVTLTAGAAAASTTITATLLAGTTQPVSFSLSALPAGVSAAFSVASCSPTCSTVVTFTAGAAAATAGTSTITVTGTSANTPNRTTTFTLTVNVLPRTLSIVSGNNQTGVINAPLPKPLVVAVAPPEPPVTVTWTVTGGAIPSAPSTPTVGGLAQITLTLGPTPGPVSVTASIVVGGVVVGTSVTFVVNDATAAAVAGLKTFSVLGNLAVTTTNEQTRNIGLRLAALRRGTGGGVSISGLSVNVAGQAVPLEAVTTLLTSAPGGGASADRANPFGGLGIFLNGQGSFGDQDGTAREPGFKFHTEGLTLGSDYRLTDTLVLGAAAGYLHTASSLDAAGGRVTLNGYSLSAFASYYQADRFYLDAIATYGWNDYGVTRHVTIADTSATAKSDPDGRQFAVSLAAGYNVVAGPLTLGPTAKVNYINVRIDGFAERGADLFTLRVNNQRVESLTTDLGGQLSYAISTPWGVLSPLARAEWEHEFKGGNRLITGSLAADPLRTVFGAPTNSPDRDYVNLALGLTATLPRGVSGFAHYETVLGRSHVTTHAFTAGLRFQFE